MGWCSVKITLPFQPCKTPNDIIYRPLIAAEVEHNQKKLVFNFLVDSGADFSLLSRDCAQKLGMDFSQGRTRPVNGILGHKVGFVEKRVKLAVPGFDKPFESVVFISNEFSHQDSILGRDNFFVLYRVGFDQKARELVLDDRR